jgi:two-component sensor histidine kinase
MRRIQALSLRISLFLMLLLLLGPTAGLLIYSAYEQRTEKRNDATAITLTAVREIARRSEYAVRDTEHLLSALRLDPEIRDVLQPECNRRMAEHLAANPLYTSLGVADSQGNLVCSSVPPATQVNFADRSYFIAARDTRSFAISELLIGRVNNRVSVGVGMPLVPSTDLFKGVIIAGIDFHQLISVLAGEALPAHTTVTIADANGTVILRNEDREKWLGKSLADTSLAGVLRSNKPGAIEVRGADGQQRLHGFQHLSFKPGSVDGYIIAGIPSSGIYAHANSSLRRNLWIIVGVGCVALVASVVVAQVFIVRRVRTLTATAEAFGKGDRTARSRLGESGGEIGTLAREFDRMAEAVQQREEQVEEQARQLRITARQREALLREVHHRVKNNLQIITSLISLQKGGLTDPHSAAALTVTENRIRAMCLIHEQVYRAQELGLIALGPYLQELCQHLSIVFGEQSSHVWLSVEADDIVLPVDRAVPCGLIANELVSNAYEHGFPAGRSGQIRIKAARTQAPGVPGLEGARVRLSVADDGAALPQSFDVHVPTSMGLQIVNSLVAQLKGTIEVRTDGMKEFAIEFPLM